MRREEKRRSLKAVAEALAELEKQAKALSMDCTPKITAAKIQALWDVSTHPRPK